MKTRLLLTVAELSIVFILPVFAQQKDTVDQRITQQRDLLGDAALRIDELIAG